MSQLGLQYILTIVAAQFDFVDALLNLIFSAFGLFFIFFIAIFVGIFIFAFYMICKSMRSAAKDMDMPRSIPVTTTSRSDRQLLRESLPAECPNCDAPLKYNEVRWTGPRQAECPYCGEVVELEETIIEDD
jgi:hypothetical protein